MATAEAGEGGEVKPPGLGPRTRRSQATTTTRDMAGGGGEEEREGPLVYVLSLPAAALPLPVAVSCLQAAVPRKARTRLLPRARPSAWWAFKLAVPPPEQAKKPPEEVRLPVPPPEETKNPLVETRFPVPPPEEARELPDESTSPRPQRLRVRLAPPLDLDAAAPVKKKKKKLPKRAKSCLHCGSTETPQWRSGPMGRSTLCNACGVRLRAAGALREREHRPPRRTEMTVAEQQPAPPPPESPVSESPPDSPIWQPGALRDVYLVRRTSKRRRPPTKKSAPSPAIYLVRKKPYRPRMTGKRCLHCGSTSTPQWRHGPMGRSTLCNACGVRYRQGRLLPEYRPVASPTFKPSEHANHHRAVLQLHRQRQDKNHHPLPPEQAKPVGDGLANQRVGGNTGDPAVAAACGGDDLIDMLQLHGHRQVKHQYPPTPLHQPLPVESIADPRAGGHNDAANAATGCGSGNDLTDEPSSLDELLLDGPSAPLIVDGDEFLTS
ncbi:hypothetical protein ACP70R_020501 [Stipagrostis hirtigluma subsp. patula]